MPPRKVTIEDISQRTGLSRGTVSRALNDRPDISQKTKQRVLEACRALHYVPSHAARSLATGRNYAVLVAVDQIDDPFCASYVRGVLDEATRSHYGVYILELGHDAAIANERLASVSAERVDAALFATALDAQQARTVSKTLAECPVAAVAPIDGIKADVLGPDYAEAGRLAGRFLASFRTPSVLYLHRTSDTAIVEGVREVLGEAAKSAIVAVDDAAALEAEPVRERLRKSAAVAASTDALALAAIAELGQLGRRAGSNVPVLGCGNAALGAAEVLALSTIDLGGGESGRRAMRTLLDRLGGERQDAPQQVAIAPKLLARSTTQLR